MATSGELDNLTKGERDVLLRVMERAKEFDKANAGKAKYMPLEGQLYKWTNPIKGWQPRWFYVDHDQGVLHYCTSEEKRKLPPRASLHLWGAVVSPSDEDAQSFAIQAANNETYRLKAADAKDRQSWVSKLRQEVEHANGLAAGSKELLQSSVQSTSTNLQSSVNSSTSGAPSNSSSSHPSTPTGATPTRKVSKKTQLSAPLHLSITKLGHKKGKRGGGGGGESTPTSFQDNIDVFPGGDEMLESLTRLQSLQETLQQQLEKTEGTGVLPHDKNVLLVKATSVAAVQSVQDCLAMMNVNLGRHSRGTSPSHSVSQPVLAATPTKQSSSKKKLGRKRPMSMVEPRNHQRGQPLEETEDIWDEEEEGIIRSTSVSEVQRHKTTLPSSAKRLSKEAP